VYKRLVYATIWPDIGNNGIDGGMRKLQWHFSNFGFCNGISPTSEICNGIDPINP
jgi:hypothetical protein